MERVVLELSGVRKSYGALVAVEALDLQLRAGEFLTFLGPSGSGKTTTLMMVAGLQHPDAGGIRLNGQSVERLPPYRRDIGMVFQHYALFPHMTVRRNVAFPLEMRGVSKSKIDQQVGDALRVVGLPDHGDRLPKQLSGGQQQRVALARAMVYEPALLLMDEPLGALDRKLREQLQLEIKRVHRERQISILYVTHDQEEALTMSDRIAVFDRGRIEQIGTPEELYETPATRFVAGFIGDTNFFEGRVLGLSNGICEIETGAGRVQARAGNGLVVGGRASVAVRPERMLMSSESAETGLRGRISDVTYLGNARRSAVRLSDGVECFVLRQADMPADAPVGQEVRLSWPTSYARAFPG
jgi:putative spermidine/putrescine transport system ATP-binding protein